MAASAAVGIAGIALILVLQRWLPTVPAVLVMVVLSIAATSASIWPTTGSAWSGCSAGLPAALELTAGDLREIDAAASKIAVQGARYPENLERMTGR